MRRLLIISFDAVGDTLFPQLLRRPHFAQLAAGAAVRRGVQSVFLTNTYPVHASVATGRPPCAHGLINNTAPFPQRHPQWCYEERLIGAKTLWRAAAEKGLETAAVMWPVTGGARTIRYNIPELMARPGESQLRLNLRYGTRLLQLHMFLKYRRLLRGISQPARDTFATACMAHVLKKKAPALALMHLTAYDTLCHEHGLGSPELEAAYAALDENLGALLDAANGRYDVILFSDHAQLPAQNPLLPNELLVRLGHLAAAPDGGYVEGDCFFECSGGSAFFHPGRLTDARVAAVRQKTAALEGFGRFLTNDEMETCGRPRLPFGFAARPGWACEAFPTGEKANHGYPVDYDHYQVFYLRSGQGVTPGEAQGGSLLDIAPLAAEILGLDMGL